MRLLCGFDCSSKRYDSFLPELLLSVRFQGVVVRDPLEISLCPLDHRAYISDFNLSFMTYTGPVVQVHQSLMKVKEVTPDERHQSSEQIRVIDNCLSNLCTLLVRIGKGEESDARFGLHSVPLLPRLGPQ